MYKVQGVYDGARIVLLDPLPIPPHTAVEVSVSEQPLDAEGVYWLQLQERGLVKQVRPQPGEEEPYTPIAVSGKPISETILEERR